MLAGLKLPVTQKKPIALLEASARQAFLPMNQSALKDLAQLLAVKTCGTDTFDIVKTLVEKFVPKAAPEEIAAILELRCADSPETYAEVLESAECQDAFGEDELKELERFQESRQKPARKEFEAKLNRFRHAVSTAAWKRQSSASGAATAEKKLISAGTRLYPKVAAANELSDVDALSFLPPGSTARKSSQDNRWVLKWSCHQRTRTWTMYGELEAFSLCAVYLWEKYAESGGQKCPHEWILKRASG